MLDARDNYLVEVGFGFTARNGERGFSRGNFIPYQTVCNFSWSHNRNSVFCSAYRYTVKDADKSTLYGDFYLDFDDADSFENVRDDAVRTFSYLKVVYHIPEEQLRIYFSGNKGVHIIVPAELLGIEPMPMLNGIFKHIAMNMKTYSPHKTLDTKIYDNKRMFRIPNTQHEKSGLWKIPITAKELRELPEEDIRSLASSPREGFTFEKILTANHIARTQFQKDIQEFYVFDKESRKDRRYQSKYNFVPPCIKMILENGAEEGQRNITIACLTCFYKNSGKSMDESLEAIEDWNSKNSKPTPEGELKKTVRSMFMGSKDFGCSTLKTISQCDEQHCPLGKKKGANNNADRSKNQETQRRGEAS